jgi:hypothetical protein
LTVTADERAAYAADVREARDRVREETDLGFDLPGTVEIQHRHHWIDANVNTFERVMAPIEQQAEYIPGIARVVNTGSMADRSGGDEAVSTTADTDSVSDDPVPDEVPEVDGAEEDDDDGWIDDTSVFSPDSATDGSSGSCEACGESLPGDSSVTFCPNCGQQIRN